MRSGDGCPRITDPLVFRHDQYMSLDPSSPSANPDGTKYDINMIRTIRGTESRTRAKWEKDGWEFVSQDQGTLRTQMTFRKPKTPVSWKPFAVIGGALAVIAIIIGINVALSSDGNDTEPAATTSPTSTPRDEPEPSSEPTTAAEPTAAPESVVLTAENNADLAALLAGPQDGPTVETFATKYEGQTIEFDGAIGAMNPHDGDTTRYDILISVGDYSETQSFGGPSFQFRDVNITNDLNLTGNVPDSIGVGNNLHVVARVGAYEPDTTLFLLDPVTTQVR